MIPGRFGDTTGRAFLEGQVVIPSLGIFRRSISFLFDTGADHSVLMPMDAQRCGVDPAKLPRKAISRGIGGQTLSHVERALLIFQDPGIALYIYEIDLLIKPTSEEIDRVPSLLGRDVTDRWKIIYHGEMKQFSADPLSYDHKFSVAGISA